MDVPDITPLTYEADTFTVLTRKEFGDELNFIDKKESAGTDPFMLHVVFALFKYPAFVNKYPPTSEYDQAIVPGKLFLTTVGDGALVPLCDTTAS